MEIHKFFKELGMGKREWFVISCAVIVGIVTFWLVMTKAGGNLLASFGAALSLAMFVWLIDVAIKVKSGWFFKD